MVEAVRTIDQGPLMRPVYKPTPSTRVNLALTLSAYCAFRLVIDNVRYVGGKIKRSKKAKLPFGNNVHHCFFGGCGAVPYFYKGIEFELHTGKSAKSSCHSSPFSFNKLELLPKSATTFMKKTMRVEDNMMLHTCPPDTPKDAKSFLLTPVPSSFHDSFDPTTYATKMEHFVKKLKNNYHNMTHVIFDPRVCVVKQPGGDSLTASFRNFTQTRQATEKMVEILMQKYASSNCQLNTSAFSQLYTKAEIDNRFNSCSNLSHLVRKTDKQSRFLEESPTNILLSSGALVHHFPCKSPKSSVKTPTLVFPLPQVVRKPHFEGSYEDKIMAWLDTIPTSVKQTHNLVFFDTSLHFSKSEEGPLEARLKPFDEQQKMLPSQIEQVLGLDSIDGDVKLAFSGSCLAAPADNMAEVLNRSSKPISCAALPFPKVGFGVNVLCPNLLEAVQHPLMAGMLTVDSFFKRKIPPQTHLFNALHERLVPKLQKNTHFYAKSDDVAKNKQRFIKMKKGERSPKFVDYLELFAMGKVDLSKK